MRPSPRKPHPGFHTTGCPCQGPQIQRQQGQSEDRPALHTTTPYMGRQTMKVGTRVGRDTGHPLLTSTGSMRASAVPSSNSLCGAGLRATETGSVGSLQPLPSQGLPRRRGGSRLFKVLLWKVLKSRLVRKVGERKTSTFEKDTPGTPEVRENNAGNARFMIPTGPILTASS